MGKFKAGDVVGYEGTNGKVGPLEVDYQRTNSTEVWLTKGTWISASRLFLWEEPQDDDELPPAPESVRYNEGTVGFAFEVKSLVESTYHPNRIRLGVLCGDRDITHKYVVIDPDTALQLAHDLNRMANEIKRKERNG